MRSLSYGLAYRDHTDRVAAVFRALPCAASQGQGEGSGAVEPGPPCSKGLLEFLSAEGLARRILSQTTTDDPPASGTVQLGLFAPPASPVEEELCRLDVDGLTPIEALLKLRELKERLKG